MNFGFTDEQQEIQSTAKAFLADRYKPEVVRELAESGRYDDGLWTQICELGWPGLALSEEHGGQDLGMVELAILCEELGYTCAPTPFLSNAVAGLAIRSAGSESQKSSLLGGSASGEELGTVGIIRKGGTDEGGTAPLTPDASAASFIVLFDSVGGVVVPAAEAEIEEVETIDATRRFAKVRVEGGEKLEGDSSRARDEIAVALSAELTGVAQRAMDMAVAYAKERHQFERPIGAYQAVSHACARMLYDVSEARSLTYYAAWCADADPESLPLAAAMAKAKASDAAWSVTKASIQVHGGIGFTWEHDLHFLLKRARTGRELYGAPGEHRDRVAALAGLG